MTKIQIRIGSLVAWKAKENRERLSWRGTGESLESIGQQRLITVLWTNGSRTTQNIRSIQVLTASSK